MLTPERVEIIPVPGIVERVRASVTVSTGISVTALPAHELAATVDVVLALAEAGYDAIPHLAATQITDRSALTNALRRLDDSAVRSLFLIGGDGPRDASHIGDGGVLLAVTRELTQSRFQLGVAAYPEGHPAFDEHEGLRILAAKAPLADFAVTQLCFDADRVASFTTAVQERRIQTPVWIGVPGRVRLTRLVGIAAKIGVGPSLRFARKGANRELLGAYDADGMRERILERADAAGTGIAGFHVYSFNDLTPRAAPALR